MGPFSRSTRAPPASVDRTRSRAPSSTTIELPSEKRTPIESPLESSTTSPMRPGRPPTWKEIGCRTHTNANTPAATARPSDEATTRRRTGRRRAAAGACVVTCASRRSRPARSTGAAGSSESSASRTLSPKEVKSCSAGSSRPFLQPMRELRSHARPCQKSFLGRASRRLNVASDVPAAAAPAGSVIPATKRSANAMRSSGPSCSRIR